MIAIAVALVSEYTNFRESMWSSTTQQATHWVFWRINFPDPNIRRRVCAEIKKSISTADYTPDAGEKLIRIIYQVASLARETQAVQSTTKDSLFLGFFTADNSLFAKDLHAVRTCLVNIVKLFYKTDYEKEITRLRNELEKKAKLLEIDWKKKLNISKLKEERNSIYNQLLDLQEAHTIEDACINDKFPHSLPVMPRDLEVDPNVPVVYLDNYYLIYLDNEFSHDLKRAAFFRDEVNKIMHPKNVTDNKSQDILDDILEEENDYSLVTIEKEKNKTIAVNTIHQHDSLHQLTQEQQISQDLSAQPIEEDSVNQSKKFSEFNDIVQENSQEEKFSNLYKVGWK
jgi:hypothetical protein